MAASVRDGQRTVEFSTPLSNDEDRINVYHDDEPLRYRTMDNILGDQPIPRLMMHDFEAELHLAHEDGEPRSFVEAEGDVAWLAAMQQKMDAYEQNLSWELADLPAGHQAITLKWVYKLNKNEAKAVINHKACLVTRGFVQQELTLMTPSRLSRRWSPFVSSGWWPRRDCVCTTWMSSLPSSTTMFS